MRVSTIVAVACSLLVSRFAAAEVYATAELGYANIDWPRGAPLNGRVDDNGFAYGVDVGFGIRSRWAFELGAYGYGDFTAVGTPCAAGAVCPAIVTEVGDTDVRILKAAFAPQFAVGSVRLFATLGIYRATIDTNLSLPDAKWRDRGAVLGLGARWYFTDPWSVSVQATRFDDNIQQLMLGIGWGLRRDRDSDRRD